MCGVTEAVVIGGMLAAAAGTKMSMDEQQKFNKRAAQANEDATRAEIERQHGYQQEASTKFGDLLQQVSAGAQKEQLAKNTDARTAYLDSAIDDSVASRGFTPTTESAPAVVRTALAKRLADAVADSRSQAGALATMAARGDTAFGRDLTMNRSAADLALLSNRAAGSMALLPITQQSAVNSLRQPSGFGDLLAGSGKAATAYGMSRSGKTPTEKQAPARSQSGGTYFNGLYGQN